MYTHVARIFVASCRLCNPMCCRRCYAAGIRVGDGEPSFSPIIAGERGRSHQEILDLRDTIFTYMYPHVSACVRVYLHVSLCNRLYVCGPLRVSYACTLTHVCLTQDGPSGLGGAGGLGGGAGPSGLGGAGGLGGGAAVSTLIPLYPYTVVPVHPACIHMYPHVSVMHPHVPACILVESVVCMWSLACILLACDAPAGGGGHGRLDRTPIP
jgi:hypothetical protein